MNPINDEMLLKDSADVHESSNNAKEIKLNEELKEQNENEDKMTNILTENSSTDKEDTNELHDNESNALENVEKTLADTDSNEPQRVNNDQDGEIVEKNSADKKSKDSPQENENQEDTNVNEISADREYQEGELVKGTLTDQDSNNSKDNEDQQNKDNVKEISTDNKSNHPQEFSIENDSNEQQNESHDDEIEKKNPEESKENDEPEETKLEWERNKKFGEDLETEIEMEEKTSSGGKTINEQSDDELKSEAENEMVNENSFTEIEKNEENIHQQTKELMETDLEAATSFEDLNKESSSIASEPASEDETEEYEDVEDVEIPGEQDVDEIIVPDEAEAEDLTDDKDREEDMEERENGDLDDYEEEQSLKDESEEEEPESITPLNDAEEPESITPFNDAEGEPETITPLNEAEEEEETTKSSSRPEKDNVDEEEEEDLEEGDDNESDKKSVDDETKGSEIEQILVALEDEITNAECPMEQPKSSQTNNLDDDTTTTQASYDPLNCSTVADDKERHNEENEEDEEESVKNLENENDNENSNESENPDKEDGVEEREEEKDEEEENVETAEKDEEEGSKDIENVNQNSEESQSLKRVENDKKEQEEEEDDDDEVQFVETRNSPICIESDDDDADGDNTKDTTKPLSPPSSSINSSNKNEDNRRTITTATATVTVPKNITVTRTSARKSTAKTVQNQMRNSNSPATSGSAAVNVPQIQNKAKNFNYLKKSSYGSASFNKRSYPGVSAAAQKIIDCIELLDSSDDESSAGKIFSSSSRPQKRPHSQQQQPPRTPQKRTLLAAKGNYYKNNNNSNNKMNNLPTSRLPHNFTPHIRQQPKKPAPPPLPPPTPQSNFLNAVQLQPAAMTGPNPPAFSALLSNKNVIIPNAFYGNPPSVRGGSNDAELEKRSARWLENFLNQFCKPQFEPTHSCFVFLQRALKYKDFVRIKGLRSSMNNHAQNANNQLNIELMTELKTIFFKNTKKITNYGQRFCELTCTAVPGKSVSLITHRLSGKVTLKTCNMELPKPLNATTTTNASTSSNASGGANTSLTTTRKRQLDEDEDEYTPDKSLYKTTRGKPPSENDDEDSGDTVGDDRKRSLRTKRTKRIDDSFSYNEDDLLAEYEIDDADDEKLAQVEIQRKIEQKRLEAQKQRQQQVKSFESAFIQAFAKSGDAPTTSSKTKNNNAANQQRIRLRNTASATVTNIKQYTANNDAEDLLQATWIENDNNAQVISDDDEPQVHRIYKQQQELLQQQMQQQEEKQEDEEYYYRLPTNLTINKITHNTRSSGRATKRTAPRYQPEEEFITGDDYEENNYYSNNNALDVQQPEYWPKNVDPLMTVNGKSKDRCIICNLNCQRLVHHYVNEHRGCETYNSRLSASQIKKLKQGYRTASISPYKNGQNLYEAFCVFCNKISRFMLRYWYQHYTMHTGEYAYRCCGCGVRKPTQSLLTLHHTQGCVEPGGGIIAQDYSYDAKSTQIEAKICSLCNYLQLHRSNIVKHLHTQHNIKQILPKHIVTVVLMKLPPTNITTISYTQTPQTRRSQNSRSSASGIYSSPNSSSTFIIDDDETDINAYEEILPEESSQAPPENHYYNYIPPYMQAALNAGNLTFENVDAGDDLSFMICGMLDVDANANDAN